jgi:hypothetical protein
MGRDGRRGHLDHHAGRFYTGIVRLAPDEELGMWQTYLLAQTRNNVAQGADPLQAARTIGGLVLTDNFITSGQSDNITYGKSCNIDVVPSG